MAIDKTTMIDSISIDAIADAIVLRLISAANGLIMAEHATGPVAEILKHKHDEALEHFGKVAKREERAARLRAIEAQQSQGPQPDPLDVQYSMLTRGHKWTCMHPSCKAENPFREVPQHSDFRDIRLKCWVCSREHSYNVQTRAATRLFEV